MRNVLLATLLSLTLPVAAQNLPKPTEGKITKGWFTNDAMGCMLLQECTEDVKRVRNTDEVQEIFPNQNFDVVREEFDSISESFDKLGINVYIASPKYFPVGHRGVYHTVSNHFYLNEAYVSRPHVFMAVVRHEGWHAAQDCMAGTLDNSLLAIIYPEDKVPEMWQSMAERTYFQNPAAIPWEKEAFWAGHTANLTADALKVCASDTPMWEHYSPTPLTKKWLIKNNFIK